MIEDDEPTYRSVQPPSDAMALAGSENSLLSCKLIEPFAAAELYAHGRHRTPDHPATEWWRILADSELHDFNTDWGRVELAQELIGDAVVSGALRCAFVRRTGDRPWLRDLDLELRAVPTSAIVGKDAQVQWDDGCYLIVDEAGSSWQLADFYLFWDDLIRLRPCLDSDYREAKAVRIEASAGEPLRLQAPSLVEPQRALSRRGRRANPHGGAIAGFLAQLVHDGINEAAEWSDDALGALLLEHYQRLGCTPPHVDNARRDARAAVIEWRSAHNGRN